jgi:hypothetical protein
MQPLSEQTFRNKALFSAFFAFLGSAVVYHLALAPTVTLVDSGGLIVAARFLGVALSGRGFVYQSRPPTSLSMPPGRSSRFTSSAVKGAYLARQFQSR